VAQCPCDSFVTDVKNLQTISENEDLLKEIVRIRSCINCREKLGLKYHFCAQNRNENIGKIKTIELQDTSITNSHFDEKYLLYHKLNNYKEECHENKCIEIDNMNNGTIMNRTGISLLFGSFLLSAITPFALEWCFSDKGSKYKNGALDDGSNFVHDIFLYFVKIAGAIIIPTADIALCVGGIVSIRIGTRQKLNFEKLQIEKPKFDNDLKYLPCVQFDF
jgi:hypothetical protein